MPHPIVLLLLVLRHVPSSTAGLLQSDLPCSSPSGGIVSGQARGPTLLDLAGFKKDVDKTQSVRMAVFDVHGTMSFMDKVFYGICAGNFRPPALLHFHSQALVVS